MEREHPGNRPGLSELLFFETHPEALPLYEAFREKILERVPQATLEVKKTQISFFLGTLFAAVSFAPVRRAASRPSPYLTLTFGLATRLVHPRIDVATEPYPGRWTHHVTIGSPEEVDEELLGWICQAADFAQTKRRSSRKGS